MSPGVEVQRQGIFLWISRMYYIYILYSNSYDKYYIGQTSDLVRRLAQHNDGEEKSTKSYVPWGLKYTEKYQTRSEALRRERFLKNQRNKTFYRRLIDSQNN